jgi:methylthioribulose-1-phosphate dehydratase
MRRTANLNKQLDAPTELPEMTPSGPVDPLAGFELQIKQLREIGRLFFERGWSTGTSSNYSVVTSRVPLQLIVTASGMDKGDLGPADFVCVDSAARPVYDNQPKSSAETWLHVVAAGQPNIGAVLHTHSIWGTLLSDWFHADGGFWIEGYEMLKGLAGITTHQHRQWIPVYENTQDIKALAELIRPQFISPSNPPFHGFLMRRHGLYTWGEDLSSARRHVEILEFLFECVARQRSS